MIQTFYAKDSKRRLRMKQSRKIEIVDRIQEWLDVHSEIFNEMIEEWEKNDVVKKVDNPEQAFTCNNCGKCCNYSVDIFASDIQCWLDEERYDILCAIFPFLDDNDNFIYGLPQQRVFFDKIDEIMHSRDVTKQEKNAYNKVKNIVKMVNPGFSPTSEYCIYFNPDVEKHCMIHDTRPFACQIYPYELTNFTKIEIPDNLSEKYGKTESASELEKEDPMCPPECFTKGDISIPTNCSDEDLYAVLIDRINYLSSDIINKQFEVDIISLILEVYVADLKNPRKSKKNLDKNSKKDQKKGSSKKNKDDSNTFTMSFNN